MGIGLRKGREFTQQDAELSPPVVIINETMAKRFWPDEEPIGKRLTIPSAGNVSREIVAVVSDVKHSSLDTDSGLEFYVPYLQKPFNYMSIVVRGQSDPMSLAGSVRQAFLAIDPNQSVYDVKTLQQVVGDSVSQPRFYTLLLGIFASVALVLAAVGIYGVMNNSVSQRIHEIGIRLALGAQRGDILKMIVGQGMLLTLIGIVVGLAAALVVTRVMESLLYGVSTRDLTTFLMIPVVLAIVAFLSTFIPATRATRVDPMIALRYE
jgi:putative ABC transport system permease protein